MISKALEKLNEIFIDEKTIIDFLEKKKATIHTRVYQDKNRWYHFSYPIILKRFEETIDAPIHDCWTERIAWVYSWIPSIPAGGFDEDAMRTLSEMERHYSSFKLDEIQVESYMGSTFPELHGETLFCSLNVDPTPIKEFIILADKIMHVNGSWQKTLSTTTKLLHFTFPGIFPIYDSKISIFLFGGKTRVFKQYHAYVLALREFLLTSELTPIIKREAEKEGITAVRLVELLLFMAAQEESNHY